MLHRAAFAEKRGISRRSLPVDGAFATGVAMVAGTLSTVSFLPQVLKIWREGDTRSISLRMYSVTVCSFTLWLIYGVMIGNRPIMIFNTLSLFLSGSIFVMKWRNREKDREEA
jgi:MtN3 and saliva related transmembrane protein